MAKYETRTLSAPTHYQTNETSNMTAKQAVFDYASECALRIANCGGDRETERV